MAHSPAKSSLDVGSVIGGTYTIEGLLGRGGMGAVFAAGHARLPGKKVAIKVLHAEVASAESMLRFRREAEIASRLGHPNIVEVHDFNALPDGTPYLVLEYLAGESLARRLERSNLSLDETFSIIRQVASALAAAHREGIIHRDLKPQNVFLVPTDVDGVLVERAKVLDFGISKIRGSTTVQTQDTAILGTPQYMAPEQATGNHAAVDARTDVFALGVMIYEMLSGEPAFDGASIPEVVFKVVYEEPTPLGDRVPGLPPHVAAAVHKAMAKKMDDRFDGVAELVLALTGSPLATMRRPIVVAPGDGTGPSVTTAPENVRTQDALAQTVGSGDHAQQIGMATAQTMASGDHGAALPAPGTPRAETTIAPGGAPMPVWGTPPSGPPNGPGGAPSGVAVTAAERRSARDRRATGEPAPESSTPMVQLPAERPPTTAPPAPKAWRRWLAIVSAMLATGAAIAIGMTQIRGQQVYSPTASSTESASSEPAPVAAAPAPTAPAPAIPPPVAAPSPTPIPEPPPPPEPAAEEAKPEPRATRPARAKPSATGGAPATASPPKGAAPDDRASDEPDNEIAPGAPAPADSPDVDEPDAPGPIAAALLEAEAALRDDPEEGLRLAKRLLNQHPGNAHAWSIRVRAHCQLDDREAALAALRKLDGKPAVRRRAIKACKAAGLDL